MKQFIMALLVITAQGCASNPRINLGLLQNVCDEHYPRFTDSADCMRATLTDPELAQKAQVDQRLRLFVAYANALADRVRSGQMSEPEARYRLEEMRAEFARRERDDSLAASEALMRYSVGIERARGAASAAPITCVTGPNIIQCR